MRNASMKMSKHDWLVNHDAWYRGTEIAMAAMSGEVKPASIADLVHAQNEVILNCWLATGDNIRAAMLELTLSTGVNPAEN
ncbi:MAG: hypothetical protein OXE46_07750 [Chloroflexi bacterium]|nr:hypothetical protein [Chloroflexota bacterium]